MKVRSPTATGRGFDTSSAHQIESYMKFIITIIGITIGALIVIYSEKLFQALGRVSWAEQHLGTEGGSRLFYKLVGLAIIFLSLFYMSGILQSIGFAIFGRLFQLQR